MKSAHMTYAVILTGGVVWCFGFVLPPVFFAAGGMWSDVATVLYQSFHRICHQLDGRSFHILGHQFGVCERCASIYFAFVTAAAFYPVVADRIRSILMHKSAVLLSILPMVVDVLLEMSGVHESTVFTRVLTGSLFGIVSSFALIPVAQEGVRELVASRRFSTSLLKKGTFHA